jgi:hypothetical protein
LAGLAPGEHHIGVIDDILVVTSASEVVNVIDGQSVDDVVIKVQTAAVISGRMYDADSNAGISGVEVVGSPQEIVNASQKTATTDSNGNYSLVGLHGGAYEV